MMNRLVTIVVGAALACASVAVSFPSAGAQAQCDERSFASQIDQTAQALRTLNRDSQTRFQERLDAIAKSRGLTDTQKIEIASNAMDDNKLSQFNGDIEELVAELDMLSATPKAEISCERLNELKRVREKLVAVMGRKSGFILAQLEAENAAAAPENPVPSIVTKGDALPRASAQAQPSAGAESATPGTSWSVNLTPAQPAKPNPQRTAAAQPTQPLPPRATAPANEKVASLPPVTVDAAPLPASPAGYSVEEIRNAGEGLFGALTSEFAIVVNYAFKKYGQPNAYIIGDEGGGAFLAGLRYGDGSLFTRLNGASSGPVKIYWQGPSVGADIGATGSRALFLVYNLEDVKTLYQRFPGIDGSAYVAGGFGLTVYRNGNMLIVPIRTGLGLRLGASIAYLKFTERASLNPF